MQATNSPPNKRTVLQMLSVIVLETPVSRKQDCSVFGEGSSLYPARSYPYSFATEISRTAPQSEDAWKPEGDYDSMEAFEAAECCYTWARGKGVGSTSKRAGGINVVTKGCTTCQACPALVCVVIL